MANRGLGSPIQCCVRERDMGWRELLTVHAYLVMALEWHWCPSRGWRHVTEEEWRLQAGIESFAGGYSKEPYKVLRTYASIGV